jgi:hypothetical protein
MTATAEDYGWVEGWLNDVQAYCLSLVRGLTPRDFLARLQAAPQASRTGFWALAEPSFEIWDKYQGELLFIGATTVPGDGGDWVLGAEVNGFAGVTPELIVPVSARTRVVSHYFSDGVDRFYLVEDSDIRLYFEPLFASDRQGSTPDALADVLQQVGFDLREDGDNTDHPTAAAFALAEYLTGVRLTPDLLEDASYLCGVVRVPRDW